MHSKKLRGDRTGLVFVIATVVAGSLVRHAPGQECGPAAWSIVGPESREGLTWCYDAARANFVLYGGQTGAGTLSDTWTFDGAIWIARSSGPGARSQMPMVYDSLRGRTIYYAGACSNQETWSWDGSAWTRVSTTGPSNAAVGASMAYDSMRDRVVLFGGQGCGGGETGETWEWNGVSWSRVATSGPPVRKDAVMGYDPARQRVMLYGGTDFVSGSTTHLTDSWEWDGSTWIQVATGGPAGSRRPAMAFDAVRGRMILFGGQYPGGSLSSGVWEWTGSGWQSIPVTTRPPARFAAGLATDPVSGRVVLFGGRVDGGATRDVWRLDDAAWTAIKLNPRPRSSASMVFDRARTESVMFGGNVEGTYTSETWIWNGQEWMLRSVSGPPGRAFTAMAYDSVRNRTVLFGGNDGTTLLGDTWEWDGSIWTQRMVTGPAARIGHAMAFDEARGEIVLYGGYGGSQLYDTWVYNGISWRRAATAGPGGNRRSNPMVFDPNRRQVITFGGEFFPSGVRPSDTWAWDGATWTQLPATGPAGRTDHSLVYDRDLRRIIMLGSGAEAWALGSMDTAWVRLPDVPADVSNNVSAFDEAHSAVVCTLGTFARALSNTFLFTDHRPAVFITSPNVVSSCAGASAELSIEVIGTSPLTYTWRRDGVPMDTTANPSAATPVLALDGLALADQGVYDCVVTNACGSATSASAPLVVHPAFATVHLIGWLPGGGLNSVVQAFSSTGGYAFGRSDAASGSEAFRSVLDGPPVSLGDLPGGPTLANLVACSVDGMSAFGAADADSSAAQALRWTSADGLHGLGWAKTGDTYSFALGCSADGLVTVGQSAPSASSTDGMTAFRWTSAGGMANLDDVPGGTERSEAYDCSADGLVVVGSATDDLGRTAARWTQAGGWQLLGTLPGGSESRAHGCSADGSTVIGYSTTPSGIRGFVWTPGAGMVDVGDLPGGGDFSRLWRITPDARIAVGYSKTANGDEAAIWDAANGLRRLADVIADSGGAAPAGWTLVEARAISADGGSIGGFAREDATGATAGFIARLGDFSLGAPGGPDDAVVCPGGGVTFQVSPAGVGPFSYKWSRNGTVLADGPTGTGSTVSGAATWALSVEGATAADVGLYSATISTDCGVVESRAANLALCLVDFNCDGLADFADYLEFLNFYDAGDSRVDFNGDGLVDFSDYLEFLNHYDAGC